MHGCCGHMGQVISQIVKEDADAQIVAGIDPFDNGKMEYPVYKSLEDCKEEADVVIDFASAKAEDALHRSEEHPSELQSRFELV